MEEASRVTTKAQVAPRRGAAIVAPESEQGAWMAKVKVATPKDFPQLLEEWERVFGEADPFEGPPENALRWILAEWLVKDREGFFRATADFSYKDSAGEVLAMLIPEEAAKRLFATVPVSALAADFASALAEQDPALYLAYYPDGSEDGVFSPRDWVIAITTLARVDPLAAGNACLLRFVEEAYFTLQREALLAVALAWQGTKPTLVEWIASIKNPELRNLAAHARLQALAQQDPQAAAEKLFATKLENYGTGPGAILAALAKVDLPQALRLLQLSKATPAARSDSVIDPFAEVTAENRAANAAATAAALAANPLITIDPFGMESAITRSAAESLPDDPSKFFAELQKLRATMGDSDWQRKIEAQIIGAKVSSWSAEDCLTVAKLWNSRPEGDGGDSVLKSLAEAAARNPGEIIEQLETLPEAARRIFAMTVLQAKPASDPPDPALLANLGAAEWNELGGHLANNAAAYAPLIAALPPDVSEGARGKFVEKWADLDPQAAADWLALLPQSSATATSAMGLARGWASYDKDAAMTWAANLHGPAYDGAASGIVDSLVRLSPAEAFEWAMKINDPVGRAGALGKIRRSSAGTTPEGLEGAEAEARRAANLLPPQ